MSYNWGLIAIGAVVLTFEAFISWRDHQRGVISIQSQSYSWSKQRGLFAVGIILRLCWIIAGLYALKVGLGQ
ncbi:hypothetical protein [Sphingomonas sp.]|uniref:hypothetical protein n=1 Tax=Sphingomonas sp. TaxID=28214 RepID=UPI0035C8157D